MTFEWQRAAVSSCDGSQDSKSQTCHWSRCKHFQFWAFGRRKLDKLTSLRTML